MESVKESLLVCDGCNTTHEPAQLRQSSAGKIFCIKCMPTFFPACDSCKERCQSLQHGRCSACHRIASERATRELTQRVVAYALKDVSPTPSKAPSPPSAAGNAIEKVVAFVAVAFVALWLAVTVGSVIYGEATDTPYTIRMKGGNKYEMNRQP